ncbi:MAG: diacylglycerol kinase family protein [Candidatus Promineifilaceae bacterium]
MQVRLLSFRYAIEGIGYALRTQHNTWIHFTATVTAFLIAWLLGLPGIEWALLVLTVSLVWVAELINTALEAVVDLSAPDYHPLAKAAKDVAAGAVLVAAIGAVLVGFFLFGPPFWALVIGS